MKRKTFLALLFGLFVVVSATTFLVRPLSAEQVTTVLLPNGYRMDQVLVGLDFPIGIDWDAEGRMYVVESGYAYGQGESGAGRILRIEDGIMPVTSQKTVVVDGLYAPATDVKILNGEVYVAHKGTLSVVRGGVRVDLLTGLPWGDHFTGEIAIGEDGYIYLGSGTVTNSGVVGEDNFGYGWAADNPTFHDIPAQNITLTGRNFTSLNPGTSAPTDSVTTGAFVPFGSPTSEGQVIPAGAKPSGVVYRVRPDGSGAEVYAWGLRNPFGLGFDPDGRLIAIDQGYDNRGARPVVNAPDPIYVIEQGGFYGWPDYIGGIPITDPTFAPNSDAGPLSPIIQDLPAPVQPIVRLQSHTGALKFDFAPQSFDPTGKMYIAAFGSTDTTMGTGGSSAGSIMCLDLETGKLESFARNKSNKPAGRNMEGLNHPVDASFGPDGCLYVVDFGVFTMSGQSVSAEPGTGVVWKIFKQRSEFGMYSSASNESLNGSKDGWQPDYAPLKEELTAFIKDLGNEWGLYFMDLSSGVTFGINEGARIPAASTVKVPVVLYASTLAQDGKLNLNERMEYVADRDWRGGAGSMQYTAKDGDTFSLRELCEKAIRESDNVAWKMLERRLGKTSIADFMTGLGGKTVYPYGENVSTSEDLATYMQAALEYAKKSEYGQKLMYDLANTIWNTGLNRYIEEIQVAHKEGDITGVADDVGVIYSDHPYILSIMSQGHGDVELGFEQIGQISKKVFDYQTSLEKK